jgi:hypothetical protein
VPDKMRWAVAGRPAATKTRRNASHVKL